MGVRFALLAIVILAAVWTLAETQLPAWWVWTGVVVATLLAYTHSKRPGSKAPRC